MCSDVFTELMFMAKVSMVCILKISSLMLHVLVCCVSLLQYDYPKMDPQAVSKVSQTLKLVLSELAQLVTSFSYCFENEVRQWCNKAPPTLTQLGPAFKRVESQLQQFNMVSLGWG